MKIAHSPFLHVYVVVEAGVPPTPGMVTVNVEARSHTSSSPVAGVVLEGAFGPTQPGEVVSWNRFALTTDSPSFTPAESG
jgi:hypothetical protein